MATNQNIRICPGDEGKSFTKTCHFGATTSVHIIGANGHFHSRGTEFDMMCVDQAGGLIDQFYKSTQWDDPLMARKGSFKSCEATYANCSRSALERASFAAVFWSSCSASRRLASMPCSELTPHQMTERNTTTFATANSARPGSVP